MTNPFELYKLHEKQITKLTKLKRYPQLMRISWPIFTAISHTLDQKITPQQREALFALEHKLNIALLHTTEDLSREEIMAIDVSGGAEEKREKNVYKTEGKDTVCVKSGESGESGPTRGGGVIRANPTEGDAVGKRDVFTDTRHSGVHGQIDEQYQRPIHDSSPECDDPLEYSPLVGTDPTDPYDIGPIDLSDLLLEDEMEGVAPPPGYMPPPDKYPEFAVEPEVQKTVEAKRDVEEKVVDKTQSIVHRLKHWKREIEEAESERRRVK